ncbi:Protein CBG03881 [Caenorhabditis briggsae]|uniref:NOL1/NOP2/Sun domain family member 4 n=1 Tax=Caenorhabditis briggsae TaxID=6238 RepID=A8WWZ9_CAEBR|nr:Protein CBG03881 [Caenorhabditis briggsae]CAP24697.2 Protein CBG03881 [Caenorhabditis briggsae]
MSFFRYNKFIYLTQFRCKTVKFKPKIAKTKPLKTPSALALDHFDFYYGPLFGKKWPSIRLGLLSPNRYLAVMNTMSRDWEPHDEILADMGAKDLLASIRGKTEDDIIEAKRQLVEMKADEETKKVKNEIAVGRIDEKIIQCLCCLQNPSTSSERNFSLDEEQEAIFRSAAGLSEFRASPGELSSGSLQMSRGGIKNNKDVEITGFEGEGVRIPKREHFLYYPKDLRVRAFKRGVLLDFPAPMKDQVGVPSYWLLDGGSLLPVLALGLQKDDSLLDMCAAPGGKSLLAALSNLPSKIVCNDFKLARLGQLKRALMTYVPEESEAVDKFVLKRKDASDVKSWDEFEAYDKVLADVPCSTDRLSVNTDDGNIFSTSSTQQRLDLPLLQTKILVNAIRSVKVGGSVVYSTCTLSPSQNEAVVENAVAVVKNDFGIEIVEESLHQLVSHMTASGLYRFHDTPLGALVVPFLPSNFGPMYICKLTRLQ